MLKTAAVLRVSTDEQAEQGLSIPAQKSRIESYCHAKGWTIYDYYIDDGYSGKSLDRPALKRLIADCRDKKLDMVLVWKLDRLSRRQQHVMYLLEDVFLANGIDLASVTENIDTSTIAGRAMIGVLAVFAQLERETIIERSKMGKKEAARQGRFGGGLPYGYDYDKTKRQLVVNPIQAEAVKLVYELFLTGQYGCQALAAELTKRGYKSQKSEKMNKDQVKNILESPFPAGMIKHLGSLYPGRHEAIVAKEQWEKVQQLLTQRHTPTPVKDDNNILTGLIWCGECGARMRFKSKKWKSAGSAGTNHYYVCYGRAGFKNMAPGYCSTHYQEAKKINEKIKEKLWDYSLNIDEARQLINKAYASTDNFVRIAAIKNEIKTVNIQLNKWFSVFESGDSTFSPEVIKSRVKILAERKAALEKDLSASEKNASEADAGRKDAAVVLNILQNLPDYWDDMTTEEKRGIIFNTIKKITVQKNGEVLVELDL